MSTPDPWPPPRKKRGQRRHCGHHAGGHRPMTKVDSRGRTVTACIVCGADATEISSARTYRKR